MNFEAMQQAVRGWVKSALGFDDSHVVLSEQKGRPPRPNNPFVTVLLRGPIPLGAYDPVKQSNTPGAPDGAEVTHTVVGRREIAASIQVFTDETTTNAAARALAAKIQTSARLPSVKRLLTAGKLNLFDVGKVGGNSAMQGDQWQGRAMVEARFYTTDTASETAGYIAAVSGAGPAGAFRIPEET